jgi:hypothetical protein
VSLGAKKAPFLADSPNDPPDIAANRWRNDFSPERHVEALHGIGGRNPTEGVFTIARRVPGNDGKNWNEKAFPLSNAHLVLNEIDFDEPDIYISQQ